MKFTDSIKFKLPFFILWGVVPVLIATFFYSAKIATNALENKNETLSDLKLKYLADSIEQWDRNNVNILKSLTSQPDIISMKPELQKPLLLNVVNNNPHLYRAMTLNDNGFNVARNDSNNLKNLVDRYYFRGPMTGKEITRQTIFGRTSKKLAVCMGKTIVEPETIDVVGVGVICSYLQQITDEIVQLKFGETAYAIVVDRHGHVLAHPDPKYQVHDRLIKLDRYPPVQNLLEAGRPDLEFSDRGKQWLSHSIRLDNGWGLVVVIDKAKFHADEQHIAEIISFFAILTIVATGLIAWGVACLLFQKPDDSNKSLTEDRPNLLPGNATDLAKSEQLFSSLAAQLKTPLSALAIYSKSLFYDGKNDLRTRIIYQISQLLQAIVSQRFQASSIKINKQRVNLKQLCSMSLEIVKVCTSVEMELELDERLPEFVLAEREGLFGVLIDLLNNAVQLIPSKVILSVTPISPVVERQCDLEFSVFGRGIAQTNLSKIFATDWSGIKLSKDRVAAMGGGQIEVCSPPGGGFSFYFHLPLEISEPPRHSFTTGKTILLVEDDRVLRANLSRILSSSGFQVIEAENGLQGKEIAIARNDLDLIITDLLMRHKTGLTMMAELRAMPQYKQIPIVAISASYSENIAESCSSFNAVFLPKPVDKDKLLLIVRELLHRQSTNHFHHFQRQSLSITPQNFSNLNNGKKTH